MYSPPHTARVCHCCIRLPLDDSVPRRSGPREVRDAIPPVIPGPDVGTGLTGRGGDGGLSITVHRLEARQHTGMRDDAVCQLRDKTRMILEYRTCQLYKNLAEAMECCRG
jgi:hypothetical protein